MRRATVAPVVPFVAVLAVLVCVREAPAAGVRSGAAAWCGTTREGARDAVWAHREQRERRGPGIRAASRTGAFDVGQIAVLVDEGDLALLRNVVDLQRAALRFSPSGSGYAVSRLALPLEADASAAKLALGDDASARIPLPFAFPFYGKTYADVFVNSDGNVTFGEKDDASTERNVGRLVNGPPRAAPLLSDLDPGAGGAVSFQDLRDHATVTWRDVPQFDASDRNTFQVTLWADGRVDFVYDQQLNSEFSEGATGIAPGAAQGGLTAVDFSTAAAVTGAGALVEAFRATDGLDTVAVARKFYATHPDDYQQLVVYTSRRLVASSTFSFEQTVHNTDAGIGVREADGSADYGSRGRLESFVDMDAISKYPDDLGIPFLREDSALSVLAHEVGHRWLVSALFRDGDTISRELLGRDEVHWSFFADTDGSHLEGNDIQPQADGRFRTAGASLRYSALDQYLMGMRDASDVPPFFLVRSPTGTNADRAQAPQTGVTFGGTRKDVSMEDVLAALGPRRPSAAAWPRPFREAFVYVAIGGPPDPQAISKVERIRAAWPAFFAQSVEGRGAVDPTLN